MSQASIDELIRAAASGPVAAYGMTPSFAALVGARLSEPGTPLVVLTADEAAAQTMARDLAFFLPRDRADQILRVPAIDTSAYAELSPDRPALMRRLAQLYRLVAGDPLSSRAIVLSAPAMLRRVR